MRIGHGQCTPEHVEEPTELFAVSFVKIGDESERLSIGKRH